MLFAFVANCLELLYTYYIIIYNCIIPKPPLLYCSSQAQQIKKPLRWEKTILYYSDCKYGNVSKNLRQTTLQIPCVSFAGAKVQQARSSLQIFRKLFSLFFSKSFLSRWFSVLLISEQIQRISAFALSRLHFQQKLAYRLPLFMWQKTSAESLLQGFFVGWCLFFMGMNLTFHGRELNFSWPWT